MRSPHELCLHALRWPAGATLETITIVPLSLPHERPLVSLRGLCGNGGCTTALHDLDATPTAEPPTARLHRFEAVALGFELRRGRA